MGKQRNYNIIKFHSRKAIQTLTISFFEAGMDLDKVFNALKDKDGVFKVLALKTVLSFKILNIINILRH